MGTQIQINDLDDKSPKLLDDARLNALINRKLEEIQDELYGNGKRYTQEEMDIEFEKMLMDDD